MFRKKSIRIGRIFVVFALTAVLLLPGAAPLAAYGTEVPAATQATAEPSVGTSDIADSGITPDYAAPEDSLRNTEHMFRGGDQYLTKI